MHVTQNSTRTMASTISVEDLFGNIDPVKLDQPCRKNHLNKISESISRWEELAPYLDLNEVEIEDIKEEHSSPKRRRQVMLGKWKEKNGTKATYRKLAKIFASQGRRNLAETLCDFLANQEGSSDDDLENKSKKPQNAAIIMQYREHLRGIYQTELRTYSLEMPDFLPSPTYRVFNLALIGHERIQYGTEIMKCMQEILNGEMEEKSEVKLENIFKNGDQHGRRQFVLLEGAPGAGKSNLACFICQKWGAGELFQQFQLVIFVQLNDPQIQSAQSLANIFHSGSHFDIHKVVSSLQSTQGNGVLFVMDGWDEYPPQLEKDSLIGKLVLSPSTLSMQLSSVVVTSRPVASGKLQRYCTSRFEIIGYKQEELEHYFHEALNDPQKMIKLKEFLEAMPMIKKSCCLPLNAMIIAHTFKCSDGSLPSTLHDLYRMLVSLIIHRHMVKLGHSCESDPNDENYLHTLPPPYLEQLANFCKLAFDGVIRNKTVFSADDLKCFEISPESTLSLLHGVPSFIRSCRQSISYRFMHLMIQEFLAAHHILQLPLDDQIEAFQPLFGQPRFVAVFQFYAFKANFDHDESASKFCSFFARVFREIYSHVDKKSERLPQKFEGDLEQLKRIDPQVAHSELLSTDFEPTSLQPLSSFDPLHIVLYVSIPYFDVGYVLACASITYDGEVKFNFCICVRDDVMMYGHVSGIRLTAASQNSAAASHIPSTNPSSPPPYMYCSLDLVGLLTSDMGYDSEELLQRLPKGCATIKDRFLVMSYISPLFFTRYRYSSIFTADVECDCSNILFVCNATSEVQMMQSVHQELEIFKQNCLIQ